MLQEINKQRYRKHLNKVIVLSIIALTVLSLAISQSAIFLFTDRQGSHFWLNLSGVAIALIIVMQVLNKYKNHPFMTEVLYVWELKKQINLIQRKVRQVEAAVNDNDVTAIAIMHFYYKACYQLYTLDDNTITLSSLVTKQNTLEQQIESLQLTIDENDYTSDYLKNY